MNSFAGYLWLRRKASVIQQPAANQRWAYRPSEACPRAGQAKNCAGSVLFCSVLFCSTALLLSDLRYLRNCKVLYCTILYFTVLYCTVLYCTVMCCAVQYNTALYCTILHSVLYNTALYCTAALCAVITVQRCAVDTSDAIRILYTGAIRRLC